MTQKEPQSVVDDSVKVASVPATSPKTNTKAGSILIVEDERPLAHALEMKLKNRGYETKTVSNGQEAIQELKNKPYKLVLLDLIMPVMDGFAVLEEMRNQKLTVPVIVLTNLGQDEDRVKAKNLGVVDYFVKSNTPISEIIARVEKAF